MKKGNIILLNGVSSSGKTTIALEVVKRLPDYFYISCDSFDDLINIMEDRDHQKLIPVDTEIFFHRTIRMFSDYGVNLVVDHILHNQSTLLDFQTALLDYPVTIIGIHCPVEILNQREKERRDRPVGLAQSQLGFVHQGMNYDIEIDTNNSLEQNTNLIIEYIKAKIQTT